MAQQQFQAQPAVNMVQQNGQMVAAPMQHGNMPLTTNPTAQFGYKEMDMTFILQKICCGSRTLHFESEELVIKDKVSCGMDQFQVRVPYSHAIVGTCGNWCGLCKGAYVGWFPLIPGLGCSHDLVEEAQAELRKRIRARGQTGVIRTNEEAHERFQHLNDKMNTFMAATGSSAVQKQFAPTRLMQTKEMCGQIDYFGPSNADV